ncbi:hypothetical protein WAE56_08910 [Iodobacter sp. LRB]|uniref:hypothetical protein n=1 Tax=unclassified Iodobacter TaxID=235634 RepID=UPI00211E8053|nr:hypothetical protein [Iodobacter sp. BJB302]
MGQIMEGLAAVLFPTHYGRPDLSEESIDYSVGTTLAQLLEQVRRGLLFKAAPGVPPITSTPPMKSPAGFPASGLISTPFWRPIYTQPSRGIRRPEAFLSFCFATLAFAPY